jgi:hypothetical protein
MRRVDEEGTMQATIPLAAGLDGIVTQIRINRLCVMTADRHIRNNLVNAKRGQPLRDPLVLLGSRVETSRSRVSSHALRTNT